MSNWPASKAKRVLAALERIGWRVKRQSGSHRLLTRSGRPDYEFSFHDQDEIGPRQIIISSPPAMVALLASRKVTTGWMSSRGYWATKSQCGFSHKHLTSRAKLPGHSKNAVQASILSGDRILRVICLMLRNARPLPTSSSRPGRKSKTHTSFIRRTDRMAPA